MRDCCQKFRFIWSLNCYQFCCKFYSYRYDKTNGGSASKRLESYFSHFSFRFLVPRDRINTGRECMEKLLLVFIISCHRSVHSVVSTPVHRKIVFQWTQNSPFLIPLCLIQMAELQYSRCTSFSKILPRVMSFHLLNIKEALKNSRCYSFI